jgi:hypothetical protein
MRKKMLWVGALAAVVSGGMGLLLTSYACDHPSSWLGRCAVTGVDVLMWQGQTVREAAQTAESLASKGADGHANTPAHAEAEAVVEVDLPPAMLPGHIIIGESEEPLLADLPAPMVKVKDQTSSVPVAGAFEEAEDVPMPQADDHEAQMPPCEDMPQCHRSWWRVPVINWMLPLHEECDMPEVAKALEKIAVMPSVIPETIEVMPTIVPEKIEVMPTLVPEGTVKPTHPKADTTEFRPGIDGGDFKFNGPY